MRHKKTCATKRLFVGHGGRRHRLENLRDRRRSKGSMRAPSLHMPLDMPAGDGRWPRRRASRRRSMATAKGQSATVNGRRATVLVQAEAHVHPLDEHLKKEEKDEKVLEYLHPLRLWVLPLAIPYSHTVQPYRTAIPYSHAAQTCRTEMPLAMGQDDGRQSKTHVRHYCPILYLLLAQSFSYYWSNLLVNIGQHFRDVWRDGCWVL